MMRELRKKHRVSASLMRKVRRGDIHEHQLQHYAYLPFLNDSSTIASASVSLALDQISIATPNWSMLLPSPTNVKPGTVSIISPSFPRTIEESSVLTENECSWKQESARTGNGYDDEDFSRLFNRNFEPHPNNSRGRDKQAGSIDSGEQKEADNDQDEFFDSLCVEADEEEAFVDSISNPETNLEKKDWVGTRVRRQPSLMRDDLSSPATPSVGKSLILECPKTKSVVTPLKRKKKKKLPIARKMTKMKSKIEKKTRKITRKMKTNIKKKTLKVTRKILKMKTKIGNLSVLSVTESGDYKKEKSVARVPDTQFSKPDTRQDMCQHDNGLPSLAEDVDDASDIFFDACVHPKTIDEEENISENSSPSRREDNEHKIGDEVENLSPAQYLQQAVGNDEFQDSIENIDEEENISENSSPSVREDKQHKIGDAVENLSPAQYLQQAVGDDEFQDSIENIDEEENISENSSPSVREDKQHKIGDAVENLSPVQSSQQAVEIDEFRDSIENISIIDIIEEDKSECNVNLPEEKGESDLLESEVEVVQDKKVIANDLKEFDTTKSVTRADNSQTNSDKIMNEDHSFLRIDPCSCLDTIEDSNRERSKSNELFKTMIETSQDLIQIPQSAKTIVQHQLSSESCTGPEQIDSFVEVPSPIKNEIKEIDNMLDDFMRSMANDCPDDNNTDDSYDLDLSEADICVPLPATDIETSQGTLEASHKIIVSNTKPSSNQNQVITEDPFVNQDTDDNSNIEQGFFDCSEKLPSDNGIAKKSFREFDRTLLTSDLINAPSFSSDQSSIPTPLRLGDSQSDFTIPSKALSHQQQDYWSKNNFQSGHDAKLLSKRNQSSIDGEAFQSAIKSDFVLSSFVPLNESKSRITSPELNQKVSDNSEIFSRTAFEPDSTRPIDPVAFALSRGLSDKHTKCGNDSALEETVSKFLIENETDFINNSVRKNGNGIELTKDLTADNDPTGLKTGECSKSFESENDEHGLPLFDQSSVSTMSVSCSNPPKIPFSRTRERLAVGSPSQQRRERLRTPSSPHRVETSRSPLFHHRGDGTPSTRNGKVSWYTSPGRAKRPSTPSRVHDSNHICSNNVEVSSSHNGAIKNGLAYIDSRKKEMKESPARSEITQSTMISYASPNRSMGSRMKSPLRGFYSLSSPPKSPAVSLFSRMPRRARSTIRRMQKPTNRKIIDKNDDNLSVDTVRVCTNKFAYKIHPKSGPCDRCWALASEEEREVFKLRGSHVRIAKTRSGCHRSCTIFPPEGENCPPARLCRQCFVATHHQGDSSCRLQIYRGNHNRFRISN